MRQEKDRLLLAWRLGLIAIIAIIGWAISSGAFLERKSHANPLPASPQVNPAYPEQGKPLMIQLPPKRKLVGGVAWHCWNGAPCEPWYTTREAKTGEYPETHSFGNLNGREIVIQERGWP